MQIGRRIYYDLTTGDVILDTGERSGSVIMMTRKQDFAAYDALAGVESETIGMLQLSYGERTDEFSRYKSGKVVNGELIIKTFDESN